MGAVAWRGQCLRSDSHLGLRVGEATQRSEVGVGIGLDGDHGGAGVWWQKGGKAASFPTLRTVWDHL